MRKRNNNSTADQNMPHLVFLSFPPHHLHPSLLPKTETERFVLRVDKHRDVGRTARVHRDAVAAGRARARVDGEDGGQVGGDPGGGVEPWPGPVRDGGLVPRRDNLWVVGQKRCSELWICTPADSFYFFPLPPPSSPHPYLVLQEAHVLDEGRGRRRGDARHRGQMEH